MTASLRQGLGPFPGDVIVTCSSDANGCWGLSRHPELQQLWALPDDALTVAADFAFVMKVNAWLLDGQTCCLIERHRERESTPSPALGVVREEPAGSDQRVGGARRWRIGPQT